MTLEHASRVVVVVIVFVAGSQTGANGSVGMNAMGGVWGEGPADKTAYPHRSFLFNLEMNAVWYDEALDEKVKSWTNEAYRTHIGKKDNVRVGHSTRYIPSRLHPFLDSPLSTLEPPNLSVLQRGAWAHSLAQLGLFPIPLLRHNNNNNNNSHELRSQLSGLLQLPRRPA